MCRTNTNEHLSKRRQNKSNTIIKAMASKMVKQAFFCFRACFEMFIDFIFSLFWEDMRKAIPPLEKKHNMLLDSAVSLAAKIRNKELKSVDLVTACIERIKSVNPILNAVTDERFNEALKEANEVDQLIQKGLPDEYFEKKPFLGVPFTTKESHAVAGLRQTLGIKARQHTRAPDDAEGVKRLRDAGAIPVAVTNVPEINKWQECRNSLFGQSCNPHHSGRTTGGSSGGEAALSAAIATPIALCSDIGGSTRMPAFYCGLYGYHPTAGHTNVRGLCFRTGLDPTMASISFVSRHISDLAPLTSVIAGDKASGLQLNRTVDAKKLKIFYTESSEDLRVSPICTDLRRAMTRVLKALTEEATSQALTPKPYYHEGFNYMYSLWRHGMTYEKESFAKSLANNNGEVNGLVELPKKLVGMSEYSLAAILKLLDDQVLPPVDKQWGDKMTSDLADDLTRTLGTDGVLLFPSAPAPAPFHYTLYTRPFNFAYWAVFNAVHCPVVQVPLGVNSAGLPLGIQVVAAPKQDALCLSMAEHIAKICGGGCVAPCKIYD